MTKWTGDQKKIQDIDSDLQKLQAASAKLPRFLHERLKFLADGVRVEYRTLIYMTWAGMLLAVVTIVSFYPFIYFLDISPLNKIGRWLTSGCHGRF